VNQSAKPSEETGTLGQQNRARSISERVDRTNGKKFGNNIIHIESIKSYEAKDESEQRDEEEDSTSVIISAQPSLKLYGMTRDEIPRHMNNSRSNQYHQPGLESKNVESGSSRHYKGNSFGIGCGLTAFDES
jgi:hypothetical protein